MGSFAAQIKGSSMAQVMEEKAGRQRIKIYGIRVPFISQARDTDLQRTDYFGQRTAEQHGIN